MNGQHAYANEILRALDHVDPAASIDGVKDVVIAELRALDPAVRLRKTQYFNHSFAPDLIASWPTDEEIPDRYIYLKISSQPDYLLEDVNLIADQRPIIFGLSPAPVGTGPVLHEIQRTSQESNTLVTDADGLSELIEHRDSRFVSLASNAVAQGGRGVFNEDSGAVAAKSLEAGFRGALAVDAEPTLSARKTINTLLDTQHANRMTSLLEAAWVGGGGQLRDFPGRTNILARSHIGDEGLQFLLEYDEIDDNAFWERIGRQTSIHQLGRLRLPDGSTNLEHFIRANIHSIAVRACRVLEAQQIGLHAEPQSVLRWFVDRGRRLLALRGGDFTAYFGANVTELNGVRRRRESGISIPELDARAQTSVITDVELTSGAGKRTVTIQSNDRTDLAADLAARESFPEFGRDTSPAVVMVKRAGAALNRSASARDRVLTCDFRTATAFRRTSSKLSLAELVGVGIPLLHRVADIDRSAIQQAIRREEEQGMLEGFEAGKQLFRRLTTNGGAGGTIDLPFSTMALPPAEEGHRRD